MAGFAVTYGKESCDKKDFDDFLQLVTDYKSLEKPSDYVTGERCIGAKVDISASLHRGITLDKETGSWLIAAGTVVDTHNASLHSDLHPLLKDYLALGDSVLERCDGVFAMVIYNGLTQSVAIISDPFGYFSVFCGSRNGRTYISTSALAVAKVIRAEPSELGVNCFLRTGKVFGDMTLWRDVKRLRPATVLELASQRKRESVYWTLAADESLAKLSLDDSIEVSFQVLQSVLGRNLDREGKVWTDLTGGFDTRFLAMLLERANIPFKANFVGHPQHPDVRIARTVADEMGWEYQHFELSRDWPQECASYFQDALGMGDAHLNVLLLARPLWANRQRLGQYATLLNGMGGEMWRGPLWWPERASLGKSTVVHYDRQLWSLMHPVAESVFVSDFRSPVREEITTQSKRIGDRYPDAPNTFKLDCIWTYRETAHVGAWGTFLGCLLRSIPPLFSRDIVTHVVSLNYRWKVKNQLVRHMLERHKPALASIEVEGRGPAVPKRITSFCRFIPSRLVVYRRAANKLGEIVLGKSLWRAPSYESYSRVELWRRLQEFVETEGLFHASRMRSASLYKSDQLQALVSQAQSAQFRHAEFLGRIITVEMAMRAVGSAIC